jgi:uncharacterized protein (DUF1800 family)
VTRDPGEFHFRALMHGPATRRSWANATASAASTKARTRCARSRCIRKRRLISQRSSRDFVADDPPAKLVDRLADKYEERRQLTNVYRALIEADELARAAREVQDAGDFAISAYRLLDFSPDNLQPITAFRLKRVNAPHAGSPAGYPIRRPAGTAATRC